MAASLRGRLAGLLAAVVLVVVCGSERGGWAQTTPINGNLVVVGHVNFCADGGSSDAYACNLGFTITQYTTGAFYAFKANTGNTTVATLALNGLSAVTIKKKGASGLTDLATGDIHAGDIVVVYYDGTNFQVVSIGGGGTLPSTTTATLNIPAGSMDVTGGCTANDPAALVTNGPRLPTITCTDADTASIEFNWVSSDAWNAGTITIELHAFNTASESTNLVMSFAGQCVSSGDTPTAHSTTGEQNATITWPGSANKEMHATTAAITLQGSCAAGDHVYMRGQVDATGTTVADMTTVKILGVNVGMTNATGF